VLLLWSSSRGIRHTLHLLQQDAVVGEIQCSHEESLSLNWKLFSGKSGSLLLSNQKVTP
jgi:hypothetical protein